MKEKRNNIKTIKIEHKEGEKGSITVFVLTSLLFMTLFVMLAYSNIINKKTATRKNIDKIKEEYGNSERIQQEMEDEYYSIREEKIEPGQIVEGTNKTYENNGIAVIPVGFIIVPGCEDVSKGLVISDNPNDTELDKNNIVANGNQFVWIPVTDMFSFIRQEESNSEYGEADSTGVNKELERLTNGLSKESETTKNEAIAMYESVSNNGGFYIGRYETSNNAGKAEVKKNKPVWSQISWSNSDSTDVDVGGAVEKAREMYGNIKKEYGVVSTLCYGVQWDAAIKFINLNDSGHGHNAGDGLINTGSIEEYAYKNIYDLAGNIMEWTMETNGDARVYRGASSWNLEYFANWNNRACAAQSDMNAPDMGGAGLGFRVTLYL